MDYIKTIRTNALNLTKSIIDKVGPRQAGSKSCLEAGDILETEMKAITENTTVQEFPVHTGAFLGWIKILVAMYIISIVFLWIDIPIVGVVLLLISVLIMVFQFFMYKHFIDFLYPKKTGKNIIGKIKPKSQIKRRVIVSGHHDSANVFNFFIHQPKLYALRVNGGIGLVIVLFIVSIINFSIDVPSVELVLSIIMTAGILLIAQLWFFASKEISPGAGDNLIASTMAIEIGRYFKDNQLENTEIIMLSFDAEEEGLRGAYHYAKKYQKDFDDVDTYLLNVDCPYYYNEIFFLTSDINGSVQLSEDLAKDLVKIAHNKKYPAKHQPIAFLTGGTDAGELAKYNVKATTCMAMPWSSEERGAVYHTPNDTTDKIEPEALDAIIDIFITYIKENDKKD